MTEHPEKQNLSWLGVGVWSILATFSGIGFWKTFSYVRRLFRQPKLQPRANPLLNEERAHLQAMAARVAAANLQAGIETRRLPDGRARLVLCAGTRNFREPWARDFGFASFGLLELGRQQAVKETLEVFLLTQKPAGQFPVKIHSTRIFDRYLYSLLGREQPVEAPIRPKYITAHKTVSLDGNALLVIAFLNYICRTRDRDFARRHWNAIKRAALWLENYALEADGLLHQSAFADWADSVGRTGKILYTNVLYWKALHDLAHAADHNGQPADGAYFAAKARQIKESVNAHFWRADLGYYVTSKLFDNLSSSGNLLAVAWGMASKAQAHSVLDRMVAFKMADPVPTQVVHRAYPQKLIAIENRLGGIGHYHTYAAWLWLGAWHVIALTRMERLTEAEDLLHRIARVIVRDGTVHEVYDPGGHYLSTFWYTSEAPLTWSAGMVVYAWHVYQRWLSGEPFAPNL